jgi:hypothetical protein
MPSPPLAVIGAGLGAFVFGAFGAIWIVEKTLHSFRTFLRRRKYVANILESLNSLSIEEAAIMERLAATNSRSIQGSLFDPVMMALCHKGLLTKAGGTGYPDQWAFSVPATIWPTVRA